METKHNTSVFARYWPHIFVLLLVVAGIVDAVSVTSFIRSISQGFMHSFGWLILLSTSGFVSVCIVIASSRFGHLRLGDDDEKPQYGMLSWLAMLFAAGMGAGLVFFGAAEPLFHYHQPPPGVSYQPDTVAAARQAMVLTHFHWAIHAWAVYCISALTIAYFAFRKKLPLLPSTPITAGHNHHYTALMASIVDGLAMIAVVFGVVASLGNGIVNIQQGLGRWSGWDISGDVGMTIILIVLAVCYTLSSMTRIRQGIKLLSDINLILCILLMVFVLMVGPTGFIVKTAMASLGEYLQKIIYLSFNSRHYTGGERWTENWTLTYFLWWMAWGPFVGVFIARISRGRTIREFVIGIITVPALFSIVWFSTFGGTGIYLDAYEGGELASMAVNAPEQTTYYLLEQLPLYEITQLLAVMLMFIFLVTSADSGSYVLGMVSVQGNPVPPKKQRVFWGAALALLTFGALISGGGLELTKNIAVFGAVPFMFILIWQVVCMIRHVRKEPVVPHLIHHQQHK